MTTPKEGMPNHFLSMKGKYVKYFEALDSLGAEVRREGPLDEKTANLIQMAAAAAIRSEGAVHSHARRALAAGATPDEIYHALILITSTIGFPTSSAAVSWARDVIEA
jgi:AhpD family alkylhydroperoxidase